MPKKRRCRARHGGPIRHSSGALGAVEDVYWTEGHFTVSGHAQARVLNRFGFLWDRHSGLDTAKVLLEKSPPNAVLARYLQALVDWPDHVKAPEKTCAADAEFCDVAAVVRGVAGFERLHRRLVQFPNW